MKPEFLDNQDGNTLLAGLRDHLEWARESFKHPLSLSIATGYFNPEGFALLAESLEGLRSVRLLLGAEPAYPPARAPRDPRTEPRDEKRREEARLRGALASAESGIRRDRDLLEFNAANERAVRRLLDFLASGKLEVRRYEKRFLHGKAFLFSDEQGVIAGSSNFTAAGLVANLELNLGHYGPTLVKQVQNWFDRLWGEAVSFDLAAFYRARFEEYAPYVIYMRVLWERYHEELEREKARDPIRQIRLTTFQTDGVTRAERILAQYHGVLVSDGVGLGKTFIAGDIIRRVRASRRRVLLVAPAALRDGTWRSFLAHHDLNVDVLSYEQLVGEKQLGGDRDHLPIDINDYALVVVDEAHAFRNPDTDRARALRRLLQGSPQKDLMLLTATPVNNSLWDLYYLLTYFVGHDAVFADQGIASLKDRFHQASSVDPESLKPEMLFDVLDSVAVRRTRHFVKKYYPKDTVPGPGGIPVEVRFPEPEVRAVTYRFDKVLPGFFEEFEAAIMPADGDPLLSLARFTPSRFLLRPSDEKTKSEAALVGLLRASLLKRFESSVHAFHLTAERMVRAHDLFLQALDKGKVLTSEALAEVAEAMDLGLEEPLEDLLDRVESEPATAFHVEKLRKAVQADRDLLDGFARRAKAVRPEDDPKLEALTEELVSLLRQAEKEEKDPARLRDCRKVLVFSYYAETVDWIVDHLERVLAADRRLSAYRGRVASVSGTESRGGVSRDAAVFGFAPRSTEAPPRSDDDRFDLLVCTDVLAEGLNLQQARNIINFDLPWNPMRLVQRHGRIDRIGSPHDRVYIRCFFPDRRLDDLLVLEERIRRKLAQAAASIGVESEVIPGGAQAERVFSDTREEIQKIRDGARDIFLNAGETDREHSGEEYRQELRAFIKDHTDEPLRTLPWGAGSGVAGGEERGHVFCARVADRPFLRFIPMSGARPVRDSLRCLKLLACKPDTPRVLPAAMAEAAYPAWAKARKDIFEEWARSTDPRNLQPKIRPLFRQAAEHLRRHPPEGLSQSDLDRTIRALEAPRGARMEREIRLVLEAMGLDPREVSAKLVQKVRDLGLQPFQPPAPLPVIEEQEVVLICWMAIDR